MPLVSIIVPNYNHAAFLPKRIDSILNQTFQDFELIILDDCSTDNSREVIETYRNQRKISHIIYDEQNSGSPIKQWEKGLQLAKGNCVWIAESDDYSDSHFLERLIPLLENNNSIAMVYSQTYDVNESGEIIGSRIKWTNNFKENIWEKDFCIKGNEFLKYLYVKNVVPNASACVVRKNCLQTVLNNEIEIENFKMAGDWFTWLLIANIPSVSIAFVNEHLNFFRDIQQSTRNHNSSKKLANRLMEELRIFNSGKFEIDKDTLQQKNESLKNRWIRLFSTQNFSFGFFKFSKPLGISRFALFNDYLKVKKYL